MTEYSVKDECCVHSPIQKSELCKYFLWFLSGKIRFKSYAEGDARCLKCGMNGWDIFIENVIKIRYTSAIGMVLVLLCLSGCITEGSYVLFHTDIGIEKILILEQEFNGDAEVLKEIEDVDMDDFITELLALSCYKYGMDPPQGIAGKTIKICYDDGSYEMICEMCSVWQYTDGKFRYKYVYFEQDEFESFIRKWIDAAIRTYY